MNFENERERNKWKAQPKQWDLLLGHPHLSLKAVDQQCCGRIWKFRLMKIRKKSQMESRNISKIITISSYFFAVLMLYPTILMLFLTRTDAIPPQYWIVFTVLMLSPTVLSSLHSTDAIPLQYWCYPSTCTYAIPHSTAAIPPQYWTASAVLMLSPTCTDAIPNSTEQPPQYWTDVIRGGNDFLKCLLCNQNYTDKILVGQA